ncbi:MAG: FtsQ-type POTRA domain-containing protein [Candidatus Cloacimonetes bacterium]|nr:FtsQ-type POTRA domain-containing protein [Candidatus Cloacimonadota bacterium]
MRKLRKRRGNSRYYLLFIVLAFLFLSMIMGFSHLVRHLSMFNIHRIIIVGNQNLDENFLQDLAAEFIGENLYSIPVRNVSNKYEDIVRIASLRVSRSFPNRLKIMINERIGYVYIRTIEGSLVPLNIQRIILDAKGIYPQEDLPIIHSRLSVSDLTTGSILDDDHIEKILNVHELILKSNIDERSISEYYIQNNNIYLIESMTGSKVILGDKDFPQRIQKLEFVMDNIGLNRRSTVDPRFDGQVVIR